MLQGGRSKAGIQALKAILCGHEAIGLRKRRVSLLATWHIFFSTVCHSFNLHTANHGITGCYCLAEYDSESTSRSHHASKDDKQCVLGSCRERGFSNPFDAPIYQSFACAMSYFDLGSVAVNSVITLIHGRLFYDSSMYCEAFKINTACPICLSSKGSAVLWPHYFHPQEPFIYTYIYVWFIAVVSSTSVDLAFHVEVPPISSMTRHRSQLLAVMCFVAQDRSASLSSEEHAISLDAVPAVNSNPACAMWNWCPTSQTAGTGNQLISSEPDLEPRQSPITCANHRVLSWVWRSLHCVTCKFARCGTITVLFIVRIHWSSAIHTEGFSHRCGIQNL